MSQASDLGELGCESTAIYELVGQSGAGYMIFWFPDRSVIAARRLPAQVVGVAARYEFGVNSKEVLDDCGMADFDGTT